MHTKRGCGILLHPTSLPGKEGIGTFGDDARRFIDVLSEMGISWWQMLPLNPPESCNSPYAAYSAFAGNPLLIDLELLVKEGDLTEFNCLTTSPDYVDFKSVEVQKNKLLCVAASTFFAAGHSERMEEFWHFCNTTPWLHNYALFMALSKKYKGKPWWSWPKKTAMLDAEIFEKASIELGTDIGIQKYIQWQFYRQWGGLRSYASSKGIGLIGDIPIFVAHNSADVWCNRDIFLLDSKGKPTVVAGVPPDYFSDTGQLWGNPLYNWNVLEARHFDWWIERFKWMFTHFDYVRVDHFRGFEAAWQVSAGHKTAAHGTWVKGPGNRLFEVLCSSLGDLKIIAEDLGVITPEVELLRDRFGFPGMKILQFAFGSGANNPYLPHNHLKNCVVYTGTHDNDTSAGWYHGLDLHARQAVQDYVGDIDNDPASGLVRTALVSVADMVIVPFQDIMGLSSEHRMNTPGTACGNWGWRFSWSMLDRELPARFKDRLRIYGR